MTLITQDYFEFPPNPLSACAFHTHFDIANTFSDIAYTFIDADNFTEYMSKPDGRLQIYGGIPFGFIIDNCHIGDSGPF